MPIRQLWSRLLPKAPSCSSSLTPPSSVQALRPWSLQRLRGVLKESGENPQDFTQRLVDSFIRGSNSFPLRLRLSGKRVVNRLRDPTHKGRLQYALRSHRHRLKRGSLWLRSPDKATALAEQLASLVSMNVARDIIICRGNDGSLHSTEFCVRFKPTSRVLKWLVGPPVRPPSDSTREEGLVDVFVNGSHAPQLRLVLDDRGHATFLATGTRSPPKEALDSLPLLEGINKFRFLHRSMYGDVSVDANCFLWGVEDRLIVSDIDGTITKSNLLGYLDTVQLGKYDYVHHGICQLYSQINTHGVRFVYLTARPVALLDATRQFLAGCTQDGHRLPPGPVFACPEGYVSVLYRELVDKSIKFFKAYALEDISTVFHKAGRRPDHSLFLMGFGNAVTDGVAYVAAGVHPDFIFIIDPYSDIRIYGYGNQGLGAGHGDTYYKDLDLHEAVGAQDPSSFSSSSSPVFLSYSDTRLWIFLRSRLGFASSKDRGDDGSGSGGKGEGLDEKSEEREKEEGEELSPRGVKRVDDTNAAPAT